MAVTALSVALVLIGFVGMLTWQGQQVADFIKQRVGTVSVFLEPIEDSAAEQLQERLGELSGVDSVQYVSREEAFEIFRTDFGEEAAMFDDEEFLPASFQVRMNSAYATSDSLLRFQERVQQWTRVDTVAFEQTVLLNVEKNVRRYSFMGLGAGLLIVLAALLLVGNTVRLTIYARRLLIRTMKLVGATDGFIRRPFLVEGVLQGLVAGIVASLLVWALYVALQGMIPNLGSSGWPGGSAIVTLGSLTLIGVLLGWLASWIAVRRFIKKVRLS